MTLVQQISPGTISQNSGGNAGAGGISGPFPARNAAVRSGFLATKWVGYAGTKVCKLSYADKSV